MRISRTQNHLPRRGALLSLASTAAVFASGISSGADITWSAATGDFSFAGNWTGGVVPFDGDNAVIDNGGTAGIGGSLTVAGLHTGSVAGGFDTIAKVRAATDKQLEDLPKIGKKTLELIREKVGRA